MVQLGKVIEVQGGAAILQGLLQIATGSFASGQLVAVGSVFCLCGCALFLSGKGITTQPAMRRAVMIVEILFIAAGSLAILHSAQSEPTLESVLSSSIALLFYMILPAVLLFQVAQDPEREIQSFRLQPLPR